MAAERAAASGADLGDGARKRTVAQPQNGAGAQAAQPEDKKKLIKKVSWGQLAENTSIRTTTNPSTSL